MLFSLSYDMEVSMHPPSPSSAPTFATIEVLYDNLQGEGSCKMGIRKDLAGGSFKSEIVLQDLSR